MKLNKKGREELRLLVEKELEKVPDGEKVDLESEMLDMLLFETIPYKSNPKKVVKLPVWSGSFLQKINLSDVSFKGVSWTLLAKGSNSPLAKEAFEETYLENFLATYGKPSKDRVNYSKTNIKVNFNESWEMMVQEELGMEQGVEVINCDFSFVDFKDVDISHFSVIEGSNLAHTNLVIHPNSIKEGFSVFRFTDLSGNNLSEIVINLVDIVTKGGPLIGIGCNLSDTRISIALKPTDLDNKVSQNNFRTLLMSGDLNGCYINGKRVLSSEERKAQAQKRLQEYDQFKQGVLTSVQRSIQKQLGRISK